MAAALFCHVDPSREADRLRLRADHLAYIIAHRHLILAGGPTLSEQGTPQIMVLLLDVPSLAAADAFIQSEPYNANGVFSKVEAHAWARVLPETHAGALEETLAHELTKPLHRDEAQTRPS
ncbi:YciI family protein [Nostoc sp. NIES-2111]